MESKKNDSFLSISSVGEESDESNKDKNNPKEESYHNLFNINIKKPADKKESLKEKEEANKNYILKLREKLNNNNTKIKDKKLLILPPPENDLTDNHYHSNNLLDEEEMIENRGLAKLMNPDNLNIKKKEDLNSNNNNMNNKDIISINQKDILDSNWEIKYINKMLKKDMKDTIKKEEMENNESNNRDIKGGKKRKRDKKNNDEDELENENIRSKYSKISTKKKYGW